MNNSQISLSDVITFSIGFLIEIPSGVLADIVGRKKTIVIGNILLVLGNFLVSFSSSFLTFTGSYLVWTIGYAFQSGATEALVYDSLKKQNLTAEWPRVIGAATVLTKISTLVTTALGGFLFTAWFRLPYIAAGAVGIAGVIAALLFQESRTQTSKISWSPSLYMQQIKDGLSVLAKRAVLPIALLCLATSGLAYMYNWGLLRPLTAVRFGYTPQTFALLLSVVSLSSIFAMAFLKKLQAHFALEKALIILSGLYMATFIVMGLPHQWFVGGLIFIFLAMLVLGVEVLFSQFINLHAEEKHRATTLSAVALFTRLPFVALILVIGNFADRNMLPQFTLAAGTVGLAIWAFALLLHKRNNLAV